MTTRSAFYPTAVDPICLSLPRYTAPFSVAILIASPREKPASTGNSISRRSPNPDSTSPEPVGSEPESNRPPAANYWPIGRCGEGHAAQLRLLNVVPFIQAGNTHGSQVL